MNTKGVAIQYGDVAPEAKENFVPSASESKFDNLSQLQQDNLNFLNYANPCELYQTVLDGTASAFPSAPENANLGLWSERLSDDNGNFETKQNVCLVEGTGTFDDTCGWAIVNGIKYTSAFSTQVNYGDAITLKVSAESSNLYFRCEIYLNGEMIVGDAGEYNITITGNTTINFEKKKAELIPYLGKHWWEAGITMSSQIIEGKPITLTLESDGQYSSQGLTFTFDTYNQIYPTRLSIKWLRITDEGITTLDEKEFMPTSAFYFCRNFVENYNKVVITFYSLNMPKNRLKLRAIDYGYGTFFYGDELRNVKLIQELDPISSEITINTCDFTLDSRTDMEYSFQSKQPLSVYFNGQLKATTFVKTSKRKAKFLWQIQSEDYIGVMDGTVFYGGIYANKFATELIAEICEKAKAVCNISTVFDGVTVSGYIPFTTCRDALMQVCFAIGAVADTSNSDKIEIYKLEDEVKQTVPLNRIMQGQSFETEETVTAVEVTAHNYVAKTDTSTDNWIVVYEAAQDGIGENILVQFPEPLHSLDTRGAGSIIESGTNYAIITATDTSFRLAGLGYDHTTVIKRKTNPVVLASEIEKTVVIQNATLVNSGNVESVLERCYDYLTRVDSTNLKIVEGKHVQYGDYIKYGQAKYGAFKYGEKTASIVTYDQAVNVGENIEAETEYLGIVSGRIIKQSFSLNGGVIIKEAVLK